MSNLPVILPERFNSGLLPESIEGEDVLTKAEVILMLVNGQQFYQGGLASEAYSSDMVDLQSHVKKLAIQKQLTRELLYQCWGHPTVMYKVLLDIWAWDKRPDEQQTDYKNCS